MKPLLEGTVVGSNLVIGVDVGTSATKAILFDEFGKIHAEGRSVYPSLHPHPGWVEQEAEWWWEAFKNAVGKLLKQASAPLDIKGIAVTHQRISYVPVDRKMRALRPAILWNDIRCVSQNKKALDLMDGELIYRRTGYMPGLWTVYKVMWLKENEPEVYRDTFKILLVQDYLVYKLTGELLTTASSAVMTGCLDVKKKNQWADDVLEAFGVSPSLFLDRILNGGEIAGVIHRKAADETGLRMGLPVFAAAGDQPCGLLGTGAIQPHTTSINGGTSCTIETCCEDLHLEPPANYFVEISPTGTYLKENSIPSGGSSLMNWLRELFSEVKGDSGEETDWRSFYQMAKAAPTGNSGLMLIPFFSGANAPYWDLNARGIILGLLLDYGKPHFVRAVMEGLAYETRRILDVMKSGMNTQISEVRMYGGSAKSDIWNQIFADVLGLEVRTLDTPETTALGAAICAARGLGIYSNFDSAVANMVRVEKEYFPDQAHHRIYNQLFNEVYSKFYDQVRGLVDNLSGITERLSGRSLEA